MNPTPLSCLSLALLAACGSSPDAPETAAEPAAPRVDVDELKWTNAFLDPSNLIADEIVIEGPPALRTHMLARQDSEGATYTAQTTAKGFLQELRAKPEAGYVELQAQLDSWKLVAFRRITWLERPVVGPVVIQASGGASWQGIESGAEKREELLQFRGEIER